MPASIHIRTTAVAKINLGLRVIGTRPDGYHLLETRMVPISLHDRLDIKLDLDARSVRVAVVCSPASLPQQRENLAFRAARRLLRYLGYPAAVTIRIEKAIPSGAGLGGGSSDAATVLLTLNRALGEPLSRPELARLALDLGADVPFFVHGVPATVRGIGEQVQPDPYRDPLGWLVVAHDGTSLPTVEVFDRFDSLTSPSDQSISAAAEFPTSTGFSNDLEPAACQLHPGIQSLKQRFVELGAHQSGMTGSGSAVFGFFDGALSAQHVAHLLRRDGMWARHAHVLCATPAAIG